jgi:hypothetical protein
MREEVAASGHGRKGEVKEKKDEEKRRKREYKRG